jgi:hypothetical protein
MYSSYLLVASLLSTSVFGASTTRLRVGKNYTGEDRYYGERYGLFGVFLIAQVRFGKTIEQHDDYQGYQDKRNEYKKLGCLEQ